MNTCLYCQRTFSNAGGLATHSPYCKSNPNRIKKINSPDAHAKKGLTNWAKGLTKETDPRIKTRPNSIGKQICFGHTDATKEKLSVIAQERKLGGYVQGSGRGKKGWYKGFFCDSSWELAYVVYCLEHNIDIKRNTERRQYIWQGKVKNYIPDFIVQGNITEVKGYKTEQWLAKLEANSDVAVLYEKDLKPVLEYVKNKYGKDFISLYE